MSARFLLALVLCLAPFPAVAGSWDSFQTKPFTITLGLRGEKHAQGTGFAGQAGFDYSFFPHFGVDVEGRSGVLWADNNKYNDSLYLALAIGVYYLSSRDMARWKWRVGLRVNHVHIASLESWSKKFGANLIADSSGDVIHRSGAELFVHLDSPATFRFGKSGLVWSFQISGSFLPSSDLIAWTVNAGILIRFQMFEEKHDGIVDR